MFCFLVNAMGQIHAEFCGETRIDPNYLKGAWGGMLFFIFMNIWPLETGRSSEMGVGDSPYLPGRLSLLFHEISFFPQISGFLPTNSAEEPKIFTPNSPSFLPQDAVGIAL